MNQPKHLSVAAELEEIRPLYDFVLVRRLDDDGKKDGLVILPNAARNPMKPGVKQGKVIACGAGDKVAPFAYECCVKYYSWANESKKCPKCSKSHHPIAFWEDERADMNVKPGDTVLYQRAPANNVVINGGEYVFLHEESQILAVIEA